MTFANYLKAQLTDFVDVYKRYFTRTLSVVLVLATVAFVLMALLVRFSINEHTSLFNTIVYRYSSGFKYSIVDLSIILFLFFVSIFSVVLLRLTKDESIGSGELSFSIFIKNIHIEDMVFLLLVVLLCSGIDYGLFSLYRYTSTRYTEFGLWCHRALLFLRIYIPYVLFSITIYKLTSTIPLKLNFKKIVFLLVSLWLLYSFMFEASHFIRDYIFGLILAPCPEYSRYIYESLFGIPFSAFSYLLYYSAMTTSLRLLNDIPAL